MPINLDQYLQLQKYDTIWNNAIQNKTVQWSTVQYNSVQQSKHRFQIQSRLRLLNMETLVPGLIRNLFQRLNVMELFPYQ